MHVDTKGRRRYPSFALVTRSLRETWWIKDVARSCNMFLPVLDDVTTLLSFGFNKSEILSLKTEKNVVDFIEKCCQENTGSEDLTNVVIEKIKTTPTEKLQDLVTRLHQMLETTRDPLGKEAYAITTLLVSCISATT